MFFFLKLFFLRSAVAPTNQNRWGLNLFPFPLVYFSRVDESTCYISMQVPSVLPNAVVFYLWLHDYVRPCMTMSTPPPPSLLTSIPSILFAAVHSYERHAILEWFSTCASSGRPPSSPMTGEEIRSGDLTSNLTLKSRIQVGGSGSLAPAVYACIRRAGERENLASFCFWSFVRAA